MFFFFLVRRPPISTRPDTLFPYTSLFRSTGPGATLSATLQRTRPLPASSAQALASRLASDHASQARQIAPSGRSEEHTSELQSLMRISYAVFCLKKKKPTKDIS